jgi:hypothetical protein
MIFLEILGTSPLSSAVAQMRKLESHYRQENGFYLIEIRLNKIDQIFNSLDPLPFIEREIDRNAKNYIVESLQELPLNSKAKVLLYIPHAIDPDASKLVSDAIHNYFNYCQDVKARELRQLLQTGRIYLAIALVFLGTCITIDNLISSWFGGTIVKILHEGLFIVGWVAMWRPIEIFLYDWVPIDRDQRIFRKLSKVPIEIKPLDQPINI